MSQRFDGLTLRGLEMRGTRHARLQGFGVRGSGSRVQGSGFRVSKDLRIELGGVVDEGLGFRVEGLLI
jgi:hypothetical protein